MLSGLAHGGRRLEALPNGARDGVSHHLVLVHLAGAKGGHRAQNDVLVKRFRVCRIAAGMGTNQIKVVHLQWAVVPNHQEHADALGLSLDQTLQSKNGTTTTALLEEDAIRLRSQAREIVVRRIGWFLGQYGFKVIQQFMEFRGSYLHQRVNSGSVA